MKRVFREDIALGNDLRLIRILLKREDEHEYPMLLKWAVQVIYSDGGTWVMLCRIDNYPHEGYARPHIHEYGKEGVKACNLDFDDAKSEIKRIAQRVLRDRFNDIRTLD